MSAPEDGHPCLWWSGGDIPDEAPGVREAYDAMLKASPQRDSTIPRRADLLARACRGGRRG